MEHCLSVRGSPTPALAHSHSGARYGLPLRAVLWLVLASLALSLLYGLIRAPQDTAELGGLLVVSSTGVGKLLPLWSLSGQSSFSPYQLGLTAWASEICTVLLVVFGAEKLTRFGVVRRGLASIQHKAQLVLNAYPCMQKTTLIAIAFFVMLPLPGTGALVGSFIGVLVGIQRRALIVTVAIGSLTGCMGVAFAAAHCGHAIAQLAAIQTEPAVFYPAIAATLALMGLAGYWLAQAYRRVMNG